MSTATPRPALALRAIGWIATPLIYVLLIRIVICEIRHPPAPYHWGTTAHKPR
jgi:hypothetical protein